MPRVPSPRNEGPRATRPFICNLVKEACQRKKLIFKQTLRRCTNILYGSRNALSITGLIIDSVHFLTEKSSHFINWAQAAQSIKFLPNEAKYTVKIRSIFRRSIRLKQTDRTCWRIQTHSDELNWKSWRRILTTFMELILIITLFLS